MVMRNQHDGTNSSEWWDDLPPRVKRRVSRHRPEADEEPNPPTTHPLRRRMVSDLSRLAILFLAVAVANLLFLVLALSFLASRGPIGH